MSNMPEREREEEEEEEEEDTKPGVTTLMTVFRKAARSIRLKHATAQTLFMLLTRGIF